MHKSLTERKYDMDEKEIKDFFEKAVDAISDERKRISRKCDCGGELIFKMQSLGFDKETNTMRDYYSFQCNKCKKNYEHMSGPLEHMKEVAQYMENNEK